MDQAQPATGHSQETMRALEIILEAWDTGAEDGVAPELMAYAALFTALTDLVTSFGEDNVVTLVRGLVNRVEKGEFSTPRSLQ